ncbi:AAA family ATPase [Enterocloster bolteae]|uniref:AAA family ATPase n=1 Tax=Lachnospiraceae TaxID=186803 RepID=UPI000E44B2AF|nr:AAA family ATPase [Hungatella hathewayi]RGO62213.1 transposase [Hungatella hathewayi]
MKYDSVQTVSAVYTENPLAKTINPYLEAMPELVDIKTFTERLKSLPEIPYNVELESPEVRRRYLQELNKLFIPMDYMYVIYDMLYRAIEATYGTKGTVESIRQLNSVYEDFRAGESISHAYSTQAFSGAVLGVPGIGKTSTIIRCLNLIPQVIVHTKYKDRPNYTKQINYLRVECPSDCSVKTLAFGIVASIDKAIGSEYFNQMTLQKSLSASSITTKLKIICMNHHVGVIVIDEIQNAVTTAQKNKQIKPLIKFLVELTNDTSTSLCFIGTLAAEELFMSEDHLKRRTRGLRLLPMKPDAIYRNFLDILWAYQLTLNKTELTTKIANKLYDYSGGIPAYMVKIYTEAQVQAILSEKETIDDSMIQKSVNILSLDVPKTYLRGTSISDFEIKNHESDVLIETGDMTEEEGVVKREYANQRGRKAVPRDKYDLINLFEKNMETDRLIYQLDQFGLIERI